MNLPFANLLAQLKQERQRIGMIVSGVYVVLIIISAIAILLLSDSFEAFQAFQLRQPIYLFISIGISVLGLLLAGLAWHRIAHRFEMVQPFWLNLRGYLFSALGSLIPGGVWNIMGRVAFYEVQQANSPLVLIAMLIETLLTGVAATLIYAGLLILTAQSITMPAVWVGLIIAAGVLAALHPAIYRRLWRVITQRIALLRKNPAAQNLHFPISHLSRWIALEASVILLGGVNLYTFLLSFSPLPTETLIPIMAAWAASIMTGALLFWFPGNRVLRDGVMVLVLIPAFGATQAVLIAVVLRAWLMLSLLIAVGIIWGVGEITRLMPKFRHK